MIGLVIGQQFQEGQLILKFTNKQILIKFLSNQKSIYTGCFKKQYRFINYYQIMYQEQEIQKLTVCDSKLCLKFNTIGYGNARYNSAIVYKQNLLISCTAFLKLYDIVKNQIYFNQQIGNSQITQVQHNGNYIMVVNFQGLITLLDVNNMKIAHQFKTGGKEVRHACITNEFIATSSELVFEFEGSVLQVFSLKQIQKNVYKPFFTKKGYFYYPEIKQDNFVVLEYFDPNPKKKNRSQTVLQKKLPLINKINHYLNFQGLTVLDIPYEAEIICTALNKHHLFYLHNNKHITIYNMLTKKFLEFSCKHIKNVLMIVESYQQGIIFPSTNKEFTYLYINNQNQIITKIIQIKSPATASGFCYKFFEKGFYSYNQNGLHYYDYALKKTHTLNLFTITNCGLAVSPDNDFLAVGDFGGSIYIYPTQYITANYQSLYATFIGVPIRALTWGANKNQVVIGTIGGGLYVWKYESGDQPELIYEFPHNINILRTARQYYIAGTSDGEIVFFSSKSYQKVIEHKAHLPIHYQDAKDRQMFGSLKHYAQIWSLAVSPREQFLVSSTSQDQTKKIFRVEENNTLTQKYELKGHQLAVTSIDWQVMNEKIGQIYVSCSDDKKIIFRDPKNNFETLFQIETSTIKEWHTLTYLALESGGNKVAIGSQNGYLFIYNIEQRAFQYAQKIHLGGIQGLAWRKDRIVTISSDLCINIIELKRNEKNE